jgi:hypothetical protein
LDQWEIEPTTRRCAATGAELAEGQEFYAVLFDEEGRLRRADYCLDAWTGPPEGAFCHFRSRIPVKEKKERLLVDDDVLISFFVRLADAEEEGKLHFRFVLALILMRKRLLKYEETIHEQEREFWRMRLTRQPADGEPAPDVQRVLNPHLDDVQIEAVSKELGAILHGCGADDKAASGAEAAPLADRESDA